MPGFFFLNALSGHYTKTCLSASCCFQSISQWGRETYCWFSKNKFQVGNTIAANTSLKGSLLAVATHKGIKNGDVGASGGGRGGGVVVLKSPDLGEAGRAAALKNQIKVDHKLAECSSASPS